MDPGCTGAVVLGATSGIGGSLVRALVSAGIPTVGTYFRSTERAKTLREQLAPSPLELIKANITSPEDLRKVLRLGVKTLPRVDLLVNTVGFSFGLKLADVNYATWKATLDTNLYGVFLAAQIFGTHMHQHAGGAIVNTSSVAAYSPLPRGHDYVASKGAVASLTKSLALALAPNVIVNSVAPGWISTTRRARNRVPKNVLRNIPLARVGQASDIVDTILFLANRCRYITGQTLLVDGGYAL
jgi:NAD(P)-dependent dehydrogenase (short-subunit alcohol dehydrogenase family)